MKKNKKVIRRLGCCLLAGVVATTTVGPFNLNKKVKAFSTITVGTEGKKVVSNPKFLGLRDMYEWCSFIDKKEFKTAEEIENHPVYYSKMLHENVFIGKDRNDNEWYGDCVALTFGAPHSYPSGSMPVFVNVRCYSSSDGVKDGTMPKGANVKYNGEDVFAPAIEIGENTLGSSKITKLYVPETYKLIADRAFKGRDTLEAVSFINVDGETENNGSELVALGDEAFAECSSLKKAILPTKLLSISDNFLSNYSMVSERPMGSQVYRNCKAINSVFIDAENENIVIPKELFAGCENISSINIKAKYAIICEGAFSGAGANALKDFVLNCDAKIGSYAFSNNSSLERVVFNGQIDFEELDSKSSYTESKAVFYKSFLQKSGRETSVEFNGNTKVKLPEKCFSSTGYLNKIVYGDKVEYIQIGAYVFEDTGIGDLDFTGKKLYVVDNGLAGLTNTKAISFNSTDSTYLYANAFGTNVNTEISTNKISTVNKITVNSKTVKLCSFESVEDGAE